MMRNTNFLPKMSKSQYLNYLAVELLERVGDLAPTQQQIDAVESLLARYSTRFLRRYNSHLGV